MKRNVEKIRELMGDKIDAVIIPSSDPHNSEYVAKHFKTREFVSSFTGSVGTVVILKDEAGLWVDGRYYVQAEKQLAGTGIDLHKASDLGVDPYYTFLAKKLKEGSTVGVNGNLLSTSLSKILENQFKQKGIKIDSSIDFGNDIWEDRPPLKTDPVYQLPVEYIGKSTKEKIEVLRQKLTEQNATATFISSLDSVAWLFNIRANDIDFYPVPYAFGYVSLEEAVLFINEEKVTPDIKNYMNENGVTIMDYNKQREYLFDIESNQTVLTSFASMNYNIYKAMKSKENITIKPAIDWVDEIKCQKDEFELSNMKQTYIKDCVALSEFWSTVLKDVSSGVEYTEYELTELLKETRSKQVGYISESFKVIIAYKENAAMMHYGPTKELSSKVLPSNMLLVDSGGQYYSGTTDITRTFALGDVTQLEMDDFTNALKGVIQLETAVFLEGSTAADLDVLCRQPMWKLGIDYKCGTGHGVGYVSTVHEGKRNFRYNTKQKHLIEGNIMTIEPGVYRPNMHGVRTENTVIVRQKLETEFGKFYHFEDMCFFPIDRKLINKELLTNDEINWLNEYHKKTYDVLSEYVSDQARLWLQDKCKEL